MSDEEYRAFDGTSHDPGSMAEPSVTAPDVGPGMDGAPLTIRYDPDISWLIKVNAALSRAGFFANAFGAYAGTWTLLGLVYGAPIPTVLPPLFFAFVLLTGYYGAPFIWFAATRRRDLMSRITTTFDAEGVHSETAGASARQAWQVFRRARNVGEDLVLDIGGGTAIIAPTSLLHRGDRARLRQLLGTRGLLRPATSFDRARPFLAMAVGVAAALGQLAFHVHP